MESFSTQVGNIASTYTTDEIVILGKGASADEIDPRVFKRAVVIAVNDAGRIAESDVTIFHADWVKQALAATANYSQLYVTSTDFQPKSGAVVRVPHMHMGESSDLALQRFQSDEFVIEDVLFLTALKVARMIAEARGRTQTVYMVGFDFTTGGGYSQSVGSNSGSDSDEERDARISLQEFYFLNALYFLQGTNLTVKHVGHRAFSALTPQDLNFAVLGPSLGSTDHYQVKVTAEITTNHFGDRARLERMIRSARAAGADYIKLQKRDVDTFYAPEQLRSPYRSPFGTTFADYRHALELSPEDFQAVDALCKSLGITWFASILDAPSFRFMQQFDPQIVKLPSTISNFRDYLQLVAESYTGAIVLSTGMTDKAYEQWVLDTFVNCSTLYLMQANSAYPTPFHDCHIGVIRHYDRLSRTDPRIVPAYSSHDFGSKASMLAVAAGAKMIEKHVKLGNTEWAHFDTVAVDLTTNKFKEYIDAIREAEVMIGSEEKQINSSEHHKYGIAAG